MERADEQAASWRGSERSGASVSTSVGVFASHVASESAATPWRVREVMSAAAMRGGSGARARCMHSAWLSSLAMALPLPASALHAREGATSA